MYKIILEKPVEKFLIKHKGEKFILSFYENLKILSKNPYKNNLDICPIIGLENTFRLRIGRYRFLYKIKSREICIYFFKADSRGNIYK